jgi:uncharacterized membrane protein YphA (DoxX/SURF4 family)
MNPTHHPAPEVTVVLRRLARPLLGLAFLDTGVTALRDDGRRADRARQMGIEDPQKATRAVAAAQVAAGLLLVLNKFPRLASLVLAATVVPEAVTAHAFWSEQDKDAKRQERSQFVRDLGLLGGLLVAVADTGGRESVPHLAGRTARKAARSTAKAASKTAAKVPIPS